jgi:hypothetical protein
MRTAWTGFRSPLAKQIEHYLATKRALGCKFASEDRMLRLLDRFLVEQRIGRLDAITGACLAQFLASRGRVNSGLQPPAGVVRLPRLDQPADDTCIAAAITPATGQ